MEINDNNGKPVLMTITGTLDDSEPFSADLPVVMVSEDEELSVAFLIECIGVLLAYIEEETEQGIRTAFIKIPLDTESKEYGLIDLINGEHMRLQEGEQA